MTSLRIVATQLVSTKISIADACASARDAVLGSRESVSGIRSRVLRSMGETQRDIADLASYLSEYSARDAEKWAATLLMLHVQLALGDINSAIRLSKSAVQVSRGSCPAAARAYAIAIVDTILSQARDLTPPEVSLFRRARETFAADSL